MNKLLLSLLVVLTGCGGGGGSQPPATTGINTVSVDTLCSVSSSIAPASYTGVYQIPVPTQRLDPNIQRAIGLKDYYSGSTCSYTVTLDRLQKLGVDRVWVYNYGVWDDFSKPVWSIADNDWQIPQASFAHLLLEAKKRNIKVFVALQFTAIDSKGNMLPFGQNISTTLLQSMLDSHKKALTSITNKYGSSLGGVSLDWNAFHIVNMQDHTDRWATNMVALANDIRTTFSGVITYGQHGIPTYDSRIYNVIDEIHISLAPKLTSTENSNISVALLKTKFTELIDQAFTQLQNTTKPVTWELSIQSRDKYFLEGWVEDGFCIVAGGNGSPTDYSNPLCAQKNHVTDFSIQAIGVQAALQAIASQNKFTTKSVDFHTSYWHTDTVTPGNEGFPNFSQSIRGKPAENIIKYWFTK
jgi:hypothetical protein